MSHEIMLTIGIILLVSLVADWIGRHTPLPRVTLLVVLGIIVGPHVLGWIPASINDASELITAFALTMVAFMLGNELSREKLSRHGKSIIIYSLTVVLATWALVSLGLWLVGAHPVLAILLGAIATATDPAATREVLSETGKDSRFKRLVLGIVAIDDAWGLIVFGFAIGVAGVFSGYEGNGAGSGLLIHLGGALVIGVLVGLPMSYLSGRLRKGEPTQLEAVGAVLVCGGLAIWVGASYLLAATVAGTLVANLSKNAEQTFNEIEHFEWPFLTVFFVLAGAMLNLPMALAAGVLGLAYLGFRLLGRLVGGVTGALMSRESADRGMWMGLGLLPQAGVAVGMALLAAAEFPDYGETILAITIGGTVIFEICGPVLTRIAQRRSPD